MENRVLILLSLLNSSTTADHLKTIAYVALKFLLQNSLSEGLSIESYIPLKKSPEGRFLGLGTSVSSILSEKQRQRGRAEIMECQILC